MRAPKRLTRGLVGTALLAVVAAPAVATTTRVGTSLDVGGFEIGNGRTLTELLNPDGLHSFKIYSDFEHEMTGEKTIAEGVLAGGTAETRIEVGVEKDLAAVSVERFLADRLKKGGLTIVRLGRFQGVKQDVLGEDGKYSVLIQLFRNPGALIVMNIETSLNGLKEVQAILDSFKGFHNS